MVDVKRGMPPQVGDLFESTGAKRRQVEVVELVPALYEPDAILRNVDNGQRERVPVSLLSSTKWKCVQVIEHMVSA